jgi:hypothetical protein
VSDVRLHRRHAHVEFRGDLAVRKAPGDEAADLKLTIAQPQGAPIGAGRWATAEVLDQSLGDRRCEQRVTLMRCPDGLGELATAGVLE